MRYAEGSTVSAAISEGYIIRADNAVLLQIPALPVNWQPIPNGNVLPSEMTRCKNFQFGVEYFDYPSPRT